MLSFAVPCNGHYHGQLHSQPAAHTQASTHKLDTSFVTCLRKFQESTSTRPAFFSHLSCVPWGCAENSLHTLSTCSAHPSHCQTLNPPLPDSPPLQLRISSAWLQWEPVKMGGGKAATLSSLSALAFLMRLRRQTL